MLQCPVDPTGTLQNTTYTATVVYVGRLMAGSVKVCVCSRHVVGLHVIGSHDRHRLQKCSPCKLHKGGLVPMIEKGKGALGIRPQLSAISTFWQLHCRDAIHPSRYGVLLASSAAVLAINVHEHHLC